MMPTDDDLLKRVKLARVSVRAIRHLGYSARVQTVDERHGGLHRHSSLQWVEQ